MTGIKGLELPCYMPGRDEEIAELERKQAELEKLERYRKQAPERYWKESFDTFIADTESRKAALKAARGFADAVRRGAFCSLVFLGAAGTGKTHLALGIVRECGGIYRLAPNIVEELRRAKSFTSRDTEAEIISCYGSARLLVIDEIGRGINAQEEMYMLYQIINERYNRRLPTVFVSNHAKKEFFNYVGIAAADRLTESARVVQFDGGSFRAEIRKKGEECRLCS